MNINEIDEFLTDTGFFYFATVDGDKPKVRPIGFHITVEDKLYFGIGKHKEVYKQISDNPNVAIVAVNKPNWVRYYGEVVIEDNNNLSKIILDKLPHLKEIYNSKTERELAIFHLENATIELRQMGKLVSITNL